MFERLKEDIAAVKEKDPAARSSLEIYFLYPGFKAVRRHRRAQWFYNRGLFFIARWISQRTVRKTGIEIHPSAKLGRRVFIDHGTGVVIGATAEVGDDTVIYQGVTLGGTGKETGKRHPTIGKNVMIGAGAKVLGPITVGDNSRMAAGSVVLHDVPENSTAVGTPARVVRRNGVKVSPLDQIHIPDPVEQEIINISKKICKIEMYIDGRENKGDKSDRLSESDTFSD